MGDVVSLRVTKEQSLSDGSGRAAPEEPSLAVYGGLVTFGHLRRPCSFMDREIWNPIGSKKNKSP